MVIQKIYNASIMTNVLQKTATLNAPTGQHVVQIICVQTKIKELA
jgi:hypothetical protein